MELETQRSREAWAAKSGSNPVIDTAEQMTLAKAGCMVHRGSPGGGVGRFWGGRELLSLDAVRSTARKPVVIRGRMECILPSVIALSTNVVVSISSPHTDYLGMIEN